VRDYVKTGVGLALLAGCGGPPGAALPASDPPLECAAADPACAPRLTMSPAQVNYGLVSLLAPSRRVITFGNDGCAPLEVCAAWSSDPDVAWFDGFEPTAIPPGEEASFMLQIAAAAELPTGPGEVVVTLESNDPERFRLEIPIRFDGINLPSCEATGPETVDFGAVAVGTSTRAPFIIDNREGPDRCLVTKVELKPDCAEAGITLPEPATSVLVAAGSTAQWDLVFEPVTPGAAECTLEYAISAPDRPWRTVHLRGRGE
jgi:hypothetical protein